VIAFIYHILIGREYPAGVIRQAAAVPRFDRHLNFLQMRPRPIR
jgi:hypothetical protein